MGVDMARALDTSYFDKRLARRRRNPSYNAEYERVRSQIARVDSLVRSLDKLREQEGLTKAALARRTGMNPASVRRFFSNPRNPEWQTLDALAEALGAQLVATKTKKVGDRNRKAKSAA